MPRAALVPIAPERCASRSRLRKGFGKHYRVGPSRDWGEADRLNVADFQRAPKWTGSDADGYPGPETWRRLFA
ncbi:hypothetical protein GCM10023080_021970 [Streptomyces pseudoechinosporeus]